MLNPAYYSRQRFSFPSDVTALEFEEIKRATQNFQPHGILGEGGFGRVFKGWINEHNLTAMKPGSGIPVAVKKLYIDGFQSRNEWLAEINYLSQLHHPILVKLIGYSSDKNNMILVHEFIPRGSLDSHLEIPVIHRGFKSGDILLDADFNPKLSDFGLSINGLTGDTAFSTAFMGTYGYAAPEYVASGHLSMKCDVYAFGVVLLELMTGLRVLDRNRPTGKYNLMDWAKPYLGDA